VFVCCCLENKSSVEAAQQLGLEDSTVRKRLSRARKLLQERLTRRGVSLTAVLASVAVMADGAVASMLRSLAVSTAQAATRIAAGQTEAIGLVSTKVAALTEGVVKTLFPTKLKTTAEALLARNGAVPECMVADRVSNLITEVNQSMYLSKCKVFALCLLAATLAAGAGTLMSKPLPVAEARMVADEPAKVVRPSSGLEADAEGTFGGAVVDAASGKPVKGVTVMVRRLVEGKPSGEIKLVSNTEGLFKFELPAEWAKSTEAKVAVTVEAPSGYAGFPYRTQEGRSLDVGGVVIEELLREKKLQLPPYFGRMLLYTTKSVKGRVLDPDGKPAVDVSVVVSSVHLKDKTNHRLIHRTKTDTDGRFAAEVASPGPVVLYIQPERYAPKVSKLSDPAGDLGDYKLEAGFEVAGKLRDAKNTPLPGRWVRVGTTANRFEIDDELWLVGLGGMARWCRTDPSGIFRTGPLPPGEYEASAHDPGEDKLSGREQVGEFLEACVLPQKVKVAAGSDTNRVVLQAVPHVTIEMKISDRDGKPQGTGVTFWPKFFFNGKEFVDIARNGGDLSVRNGRAVLYVPHGTSRLEMMVNTSGSVFCKLRPGPVAGPEGSFERTLQLMNEDGNIIDLRKLEEHRTLDFLWTPGVDARLCVSTKDGSPLPKDLEIVSRQGRSPCYSFPCGDGVYRLRNVEADRPLRINVNAEGWEPVIKTVTIPGGSPQQVEIVLEKKVAKK